jgi:hypothetical protein
METIILGDVFQEIVEKTEFIVPLIELREQIASFIEQTDKSKLYDEMEVAA